MESEISKKQKQKLLAIILALTTCAADAAIISQIAKNTSSNIEFECEIEGDHEHKLDRTVIKPVYNEDGSVITMYVHQTRYENDETTQKFLNEGWEVTENYRITEPVKTLVRK